MTINNINNHGSQIIPVNISNSNTKFDSVLGLGYNVTFTVHTAATSNQNNTGPGSVWYDTSAPGYQQSKCINGAFANKDMTINYCCNLYPAFTDGIVQTPSWGMWGGGPAGVYYTVTWHQLYVATTQPTNGATGIPVTGSISATFSKQVDSSTVNTNTFILKDSNNNAVPGTVSLSSDGKIATFTPLSSNPLSYSTTYTATITTGVKDMSGYPLAVNGGPLNPGPNYKWAFTTIPAPPPATPHSTSLTLNPITSPVPASNYITATGKLTDNDASGAGVGGKTITFSGTGTSPQVAGGLISTVTNLDGSFTTTGRSAGTVGTGWTVQAHFAGDSYDKASESAIQTYSTVTHTTTLTLSTITNVPSGTTVTATGKLTDNDASGAGITRETITFTGTGAANIASVTTNTDGTFTATGTAPNTVNSGWTVQAHFAGDTYYKASDSTIQSYSTVSNNNSPQHTSALILNPVANIPWGTKDIVTGKLSDISSNNVGIGGKTITFTSPNSSPLPQSSVTTNTDGTFSSSFSASNTVFTGWQLQAHFAANSNYTSSNSSIQSYNTVKHAVSLTSAAASSSIPWSRPTSFTAALTDSSNGGTALSSRTITFTGTGVIPSPLSVSTDSTGKATVTGTSPSTIASGWTYQSHYAGDSLYNSLNSVTGTYSTVSHNTDLTLAISPTSLTGGTPYKVSGKLTDTTTGAGLNGITISFTAASPISISTTTTGTGGQYSISGLKAPNTAGTYSIQAHFAGSSLYNSKDTLVSTLTVTTTKAATTSTAATASPTTSSTSPLTSSSSPSSPNWPTITSLPAPPSYPSSAGAIINNPTPPPPLPAATPSNKSPLTLAPWYSQQPLQQQQRQQLNLTPQSPPIANAGLSQTVNDGNVVTLDGRASYAPVGAGGIVGYQWTQLATGIPVILTGPNTATPTFTAPVVPTDNTVLAFGLRVIDNHGSVSTNPAIVYIMIKHNPNVISNSGASGGTTPGTTMLQPQQQQQHQPIVPNNNAISPPSQLNSPASPAPQIGSPNTQNTVPPPRIP